MYFEVFMFGKLNKVLFGAVLIGGIMSGNCTTGENPLLTPESSIRLGSDLATGRVGDASMISAYLDDALTRKTLPLPMLTKNVTLLYLQTSPGQIDIEAACSGAMVRLASLVSSEGSNSYKIILLLFDSQVTSEKGTPMFRDDVNTEIVQNIWTRLGSLVNGDIDRAASLKDTLHRLMKSDERFSIFC